MSSPSTSNPGFEDTEVDIIWHNIYRGENENFTVLRRRSEGPMTGILVEFSKLVAMRVFEKVISVNASGHMFCVTVAFTRPDKEAMDLVYAVGDPVENN